jgi:multidrug efflux pump subunit AcrB
VLSRFFIDRPIFAAVLSIVLTFGGFVAVLVLPVAQYPEITPPTVQVSCTYPGASAKVVADTVAAPIEQQVNGVENMLYMSGQCTNDGAYNLTVTFALGTNLDMAQVLVQNRVSLAVPSLPDVVKQTGVTTKKKSPNIMLVVNLVSPDDSYDQLKLSNYATIYIKDELARLKGVGDVTYLGQQDYSMRAWLDADKLASRKLTAGDVANALREQNVQVAAGQIGQPPVRGSPDFQYTMSTLGRLTDPEQFGRVVVKVGDDGQVTTLKDVVRDDYYDKELKEEVHGVELGAKSQDQSCTLDGKPSVGLGVFQLPGSNALKTAQLVEEKMEELKHTFPREGDSYKVDYHIAYNTTPFIQESINEVFKALRDAIVLVAVVVLVFLQNWRSTIIPLIAVPVAIVGTFAAMAAVQFSLNNLTLFGLVLAIGIVVDDAIVVVEAVEHNMDHGLPPKEAARKAMDQVSGPVFAITLVLICVFVPCVFITGITGQFFRQFAVTIAVSTALSGFNSLTLSPALCAILLKPREPGKAAEPLPRLGIIILAALVFALVIEPRIDDPLLDWLTRTFPALAAPNLTPVLEWSLIIALGAVGAAAGWAASGGINWLLTKFFQGFNWVFKVSTDVYTRSVGVLLRVSVLVLLVYVGLLALTGWSFTKVPAGFIPQQDKGYLLVNVQLPDSASLGRTKAVMKHVEEIAAHTHGVKHTLAISGQSLLLNANGSNFGSMYVILEDFHHRHGPEESADVVAAELRKHFAEEVQEAATAVFGAPPVDGLGSAGGFKLMVEDRSGAAGLESLQAETENLVAAGNADPKLVGLFTQFRANTPQLYVDVDRIQCKAKGVALKDVFDTLQIYLGSLYVNDFNQFGRTWQVNIQADARYRMKPEDVRKLQVRNAAGQMVPLGAVASVSEVNGPVMVVRYNTYTAAAINGSTKPGVSSGQAITVMDAAAKQELPDTMKTEWTELTLLQILAGNTAIFVFAAAVALVFLVLSAQYESWSLPLAVILVVPMCILSSLIGVAIAGMDLNIFVQIGFVVLVGLAAKNAILIVEFAKEEVAAGKERFAATLEACKLRLRPILMTSFAFIFGVLPLALAVGAGAEMRRTLGTAVFSGMLGVTLFGIFLTPVFFYVIQGLGESRVGRSPVARQTGHVLQRVLDIVLLGLPVLLRMATRRPPREAGVAVVPPDDSHPADGAPVPAAPGAESEGLRAGQGVSTDPWKQSSDAVSSREPREAPRPDGKTGPAEQP